MAVMDKKESNLLYLILGFILFFGIPLAAVFIFCRMPFLIGFPLAVLVWFGVLLFFWWDHS